MGDPRDIWALLFQQDFVLFCSPGLIQMRTWEKEQRKRHFFYFQKKKKKKDLCKVPGVTFLWNKNLSVFFYFQLQSLFPLFSLVCYSKWPFVC